MKRTNAACWKEAQRHLVGGVNSPVRSFRGVGSRPFFVDRGRGPHLWDVEENRYLDYVGSWGAAILGHRHPGVLRAARSAIGRGNQAALSQGHPDLVAEAAWLVEPDRAFPVDREGGLGGAGLLIKD